MFSLLLRHYKALFEDIEGVLADAVLTHMEAYYSVPEIEAAIAALEATGARFPMLRHRIDEHRRVYATTPEEAPAEPSDPRSYSDASAPGRATTGTILPLLFPWFVAAYLLYQLYLPKPWSAYRRRVRA
jgi:hypothetical protein